MKRNSKKPEVRKQELIEIAAKLFAEKGYEAVSVRDILEVVNGAPGMFYYYFKSKQDIYVAAMEQYICERLERKCRMLEDDTVPFHKKLAAFRSMIREDISGYTKRFISNDSASISDASYKIWDFLQMLNRMIKPYVKFLLQAYNDGHLSERLKLTEENAELFATFILYGSWGTIYNGKFTKSDKNFTMEDVIAVTDKLLQ